MKPHERLLSTAIVEIYPPGFGDIKVRFKSTPIAGKVPDDMIPDSIVINTADQRLWLSDSEGNPVEYTLIPANSSEVSS
jgi:hypothetical protein